MKPEPTGREKVLAMKDPDELEGARGQFERDGRLTDEIDNLITLRIAQLRRKT